MENHAREQALLQLESIKELVQALKNVDTSAYDDDEREERRAEALEAITEDALSVLVRSDWHTPGDKDFSGPYQYELLLCTGGPAVRIKGTLDEGIPFTAQLEYQDWGTPWTRLTDLTSEDVDALKAYATCFYYGE